MGAAGFAGIAGGVYRRNGVAMVFAESAGLTTFFTLGNATSAPVSSNG